MIQNNIQKLKVHKSKKYQIRDLKQINKIIIHHSATNQGSGKAFANYHVDSLGWPGIGYHFVISDVGIIEQTNSLTTVSYHTAGQNTSSIGICLVGNFDNYLPTNIQSHALEELIIYLRNLLGKDLKVFGHTDFSTKTCPGKLFNLNYFKSI
jgi:N-acetylmuramoyl-L-alanine amidase